MNLASFTSLTLSFIEVSYEKEKFLTQTIKLKGENAMAKAILLCLFLNSRNFRVSAMI